MAARKKKEESPVAWTPDYDEIDESISQSVGLTPISMNRAGHINNCVSTGLLSYDLAVGGGFAPGRFCGQYGPEGGGKSTACASSIAQAQQRGIRSIFFDHEGSADPNYWSRIGVNLYGSFRDDEAQASAGTEHGFKAGPNLMYYAPDSAEKSLKFISRLMHSYPDKRLYNDKWYFVFNNMTQKEAKDKKIPYDVSLTRKLSGIWVPAVDGTAQAIIYIDSIAAMKPEAMIGEKKKGEWKDGTGAQALLARTLSNHLAGITSAMVEKRFTIVATNQFREKPGVTYGDPGYAPGGNMLAHSHDNRVMLRKRACPAGWSGKGGIQEETCWNGKGTDRYNFAYLRSEKSKDFMPHKGTWVRWWFDSNGSPGPGIDPVFDTFQYLKMTGQLSKSGTKFEIELPGFEATVDTPGFKALILDPENKDAIRQGCWKQLREADGFQRYFDTPQSENA
jgi:RecA/RadA recombinase